MNFTDVFSTLLGMCSKTPFFSNVRAVAGWPHWDAICKSVLPSCTGSSGRDTLETSSQITTHWHNEKKNKKNIWDLFSCFYSRQQWYSFENKWKHLLKISWETDPSNLTHARLLQSFTATSQTVHKKSLQVCKSEISVFFISNDLSCSSFILYLHTLSVGQLIRVCFS